MSLVFLAEPSCPNVCLAGTISRLTKKWAPEKIDRVRALLVRTTWYMRKKFNCYLRPYRRRWGFTQKELAHLLGCKSGTVVSRLEQGQRRPSLKIALACYIIFDAPPHELFPGLFLYIEKEVLERVWDLYERMQGNPSATTRAKLAALEEAIERAKSRSEQRGA